MRGYRYEKGKFIVLNDDDSTRVDVGATQTVDIQEFVEVDEINPMFFSKPYYMKPAKGGDTAYALVREVLRGTKRVGIVKVVIKTPEHLAAMKAQDEATNVIDLVAVLQKSIQEHGSSRSKKAPAKKARRKAA